MGRDVSGQAVGRGTGGGVLKPGMRWEASVGRQLNRKEGGLGAVYVAAEREMWEQKTVTGKVGKVAGGNETSHDFPCRSRTVPTTASHPTSTDS